MCCGCIKGGEVTMGELLVATALRRSFMSGHDRITPVDGVDLVLSSGDVVVLTGPSGSGKSTLLQLLIGFDRPDHGTVEWVGCDSDVPSWTQVAAVPQSLGLLPELTVAENVAAPLLAAGTDPRRVATLLATAMEHVDIASLASRLVGDTSLGQQQRVAVARALIAQPAVVVADEPTSHQDDDHAVMVCAALRAAAEQGAAVMIAGHDVRVHDIATRVIRLENGTISPPA
jgi:ABC-type lipoprotein export system ATPase subunit